MKIFVYDSLKRGFVNHNTLDGPLPYLMNLRGVGNRVLGELHKVPRDGLKELDKSEGD